LLHQSERLTPKKSHPKERVNMRGTKAANARPDCGRESISLKLLGRSLCNHSKRGRIGHGQFSQDLSVQVDLGQLQAVNELAVGETVHSGTGIDSGDPEPAEITFLLLAVAVRVHQRLVYGVGRRTKQFAATSTKTFGQLKNLISALPRFSSSFYSHCLLYLLRYTTTRLLYREGVGDVRRFFLIMVAEAETKSSCSPVTFKTQSDQSASTCDHMLHALFSRTQQSFQVGWSSPSKNYPLGSILLTAFTLVASRT